MKQIIIIALLVALVSLMLFYQSNDQMLFKHWIEIIAIEFIAQMLYHEYTKKDGTNE